MDASVAVAVGLVVGSALVVAMPKDFSRVAPADSADSAEQDEAPRKPQHQDEQQQLQQQQLEREAFEQYEEERVARRARLEAAGVDFDMLQRLMSAALKENHRTGKAERLLLAMLAALVLLALAVAATIAVAHFDLSWDTVEAKWKALNVALTK